MHLAALKAEIIGILLDCQHRVFGADPGMPGFRQTVGQFLVQDDGVHFPVSWQKQNEQNHRNPEGRPENLMPGQRDKKNDIPEQPAPETVRGKAAADQPTVKQQRKINGITDDAHDAITVNQIVGDQGQDNAVKGIGAGDGHQEGPAGLVATLVQTGENDQNSQKKITDHAPDRNGNIQENGIRALGNRVTVNGPGYGAETLVSDIRIYPEMGIGKIQGIEQTRQRQQQHRHKIDIKGMGLDSS